MDFETCNLKCFDRFWSFFRSLFSSFRVVGCPLFPTTRFFYFFNRFLVVFLAAFLCFFVLFLALFSGLCLVSFFCPPCRCLFFFSFACSCAACVASLALHFRLRSLAQMQLRLELSTRFCSLGSTPVPPALSAHDGPGEWQPSRQRLRDGILHSAQRG